MSDQDPGDENDDLRDYSRLRQQCLFCDVKLHYNSHHVTPLFRWSARLPFEEAAADPAAFGRKMADREDLHTCARPACKEQARKFVEQQQMSGSRKQMLVHTRWRW